MPILYTLIVYVYILLLLVNMLSIGFVNADRIPNPFDICQYRFKFRKKSFRFYFLFIYFAVLWELWQFMPYICCLPFGILL